MSAKPKPKPWRVELRNGDEVVPLATIDAETPQAAIKLARRTYSGTLGRLRIATWIICVPDECSERVVRIKDPLTKKLTLNY